MVGEQMKTRRNLASEYGWGFSAPGFSEKRKAAVKRGSDWGTVPPVVLYSI